jgi:hypothetical protein
VKTVTFTYHPDGYRCSEPGDQDGEYVPLADVNVNALLAACKALVGVIRDTDYTERPTPMRLLSIVSDTPTYEALDAARAAIAKFRAADPKETT